MPTPLEHQILDDFEERMTKSSPIPVGVIQSLMVHARGDRAPTAEILLETFEENVGDHPV